MLLAAIVLALAACAGTPTRVPMPVQSPRPVLLPAPAATAKPPKPGATPAPPPLTAPPVVTGPRRYGESRIAAAQVLARDPGNALPASEVGYYLDVLQGRLKQVPGKNIAAARRGNLIVLVLTNVFNEGNALANAASISSLSSVARVLVEYRKTTVTVRAGGEGAAAVLGPSGLADQRALAVSDLLARAGVGSKRLVVPAARARARNGDGLGDAKQSRVELLVEPIVLRPAVKG